MTSSGDHASDVESCPDCGIEVPADSNYCPGCGAELPDAPSYCRVCGAAFERGDEYCSDCGAARRPEAADDLDADREDDAAPDEEAYRQFRRRIQRHLDRGWEVDEDYGDRVVLVDRDLGSFWVHFFLFLFTWGIGNLLYAWYRHSVAAQRRYLTVDDRDLPMPDSDDDTSWWTWSVLALLFGAAFLAGESAVALGIGLVLIAVGLYAAPPIHDRIARRHSLDTFGPASAVDTRAFYQEEGIERNCVVCGDRITEGRIRRYREEYCVAGLPLYTIQEGENHYCHDCAEADRAAPDAVEEGDGWTAVAADRDAVDTELDHDRRRDEREREW